MLEAGVLVDQDQQIVHWHTPNDRTVNSLPDSSLLWEFMWTHKDKLLGFGHSRRGGGIPKPSLEDIASFSAVEMGLGKRLTWWIVSDHAVVRCKWVGPGRYNYHHEFCKEPYWVIKLRNLSEMES
jgi:hypothetical protein